MNMKTNNQSALIFKRRFTTEGTSPFDMFEYEWRTCNINYSNSKKNSGTEVEKFEVPKNWSKNATDILISKFFRKAGVPAEDGTLGGERSIKQVIHRLAHCWKAWGEKYGYFETKTDAQIFYDEVVYTLLNQSCAPNSPQWFNTGLHDSYKLTGHPQGHYYVDPHTKQIQRSTNAYERPQPHACFILSVNDDLVNEGGIMELWTREARIFKYGSGVGTNFSNIRGKGEKLSGGGESSGLMSFLKIGDRAAGAIKSGGTTRRAAKMVCLDIDHPEIEEFITWKAKEEVKAKALIDAGFDSHYEGEAYSTISGQNSNNSIRVTNEFLKAVREQSDWNLTTRSDGSVFRTVKATDLWEKIVSSAWKCADPGLQFDSTINEWHTCPKGGRINASNPCSEYMFLDNTACNLASINLMRFFDPETKIIDVKSLIHTCRLWTVILEISVLMAQFPSKEVAKLSYEYRTLGLGYANLGTVIMASGLPYDSDQGRNLSAALTAIITGTSYHVSAEMAKYLGSFEKYKENEKDMLRVIRNHRYAAYNAINNYEGLEIKPTGINPKLCPEYLVKYAQKIWDEVVEIGTNYGFRNAQVTVIAPTGTIGLVMDCDTTGIEPEFNLVKLKKLAGGGTMKIVNQSLPIALKNLGYTSTQIKEIINYILGHNNLEACPVINSKSLIERGIPEDEIANLEIGTKTAFDIHQMFSAKYLKLETYKKLGLGEEEFNNSGFNILFKLGFSLEEIDNANEYLFGHGTIEGAPHLSSHHLPIFDCAVKGGLKGKRFIKPYGHVDMLAACQPFISGAISKTINMPEEATLNDVEDCYFRSWEKGLKANAIYRENCKYSQPLNTKTNANKANKVDEIPASKISDVSTALPSNVINLHQIPIESLLKEVESRVQEATDTKLKHKLSEIINRKSLPFKRKGFNYKVKIHGEQVVFLRTGEYSDGTLGEIFIDLSKEGSTLAGLTHCFAIAVSIGLQYGVPLEEFVHKFTHTNFEPKGFTDHPRIKNVSSIADLVFRVLAIDYLGWNDLAQISPQFIEESLEKSNSFVTKPENHLLNQVTPTHEINNSSQQEKAIPVQPGLLFEEKSRLQAAKDASSQQNFSNSKPDVISIQQKLGQSSSPLCRSCGYSTIRNGTCFVCQNCGTTTGCS